ncbi:MAG: hypothetical protein IKL87_08145 [Oscillospiraceae bacterium]|nr:hypothetical protein [Oscillospiraceae bacterium]
MIPFFAALFLSGIAVLVIGIFRQKHVMNCPHYYRAVVVRHQHYRSSNLGVALAGNLVGIIIPVVEISLESGALLELPLTHTQIVKPMLEQFPELDIDGEVDVMFFGRKPREAFLRNHKLAQTPLRFTMMIPVGIALMVTAVGLYLYYLSI